MNLIADLKYGLRLLRKSRGFAIAAAATLALGIGGTTASTPPSDDAPARACGDGAWGDAWHSGCHTSVRRGRTILEPPVPSATARAVYASYFGTIEASTHTIAPAWHRLWS